MDVNRAPGGYRPQTQNFIENAVASGANAIVSVVQNAVQGLQQAGKGAAQVAGDVFKQVGDPQANFSGGPGGAPTGMSGQADKIANEVAQGQAARQAHKNFDMKGYQAELKTQMDQAMGDLVGQVQSGKITPQRFEELVKQATNDVSAKVQEKFGTPPPPPDTVQKHQGGFDWKGFNADMKSLTDEKMKAFSAQYAPGPIPADKIEGIIKQVAKEVAATVTQKYGEPPEIPSPNARQPGYPYEAREAETAKSMQAMMDELMPKVKSGELLGPALEKTIQDKTKEIIDGLDKKFGELPTQAKADPAKDTKELYDQNRLQMEMQIQSMQANGSTPLQVLGYKLQRQAEMAQMFPKQSILNETRDEWKAVAVQMQAAGKSETEIKDYLRNKEAAFKDPTPEEVAVFAAKKQRDAEEISKLVQAANQQNSGSQFQGARF